MQTQPLQLSWGELTASDGKVDSLVFQTSLIQCFYAAFFIGSFRMLQFHPLRMEENISQEDGKEVNAVLSVLFP